MTGERWLVTQRGAYLPLVDERVIQHVRAVPLTRERALVSLLLAFCFVEQSNHTFIAPASVAKLYRCLRR